MILYLYRTYDSEKPWFFFSGEQGDIDSFTMGFKSENAFKDYLNQMKTVYREDGTIDEGHISLYYKKQLEDEYEMIEVPVYYGEDFSRTTELLRTRLSNEIELLRTLIKNCPYMFSLVTADKLSYYLENVPSDEEYKKDLDWFIGTLKTNQFFKENMRNVISEIDDYDKKSKVLKIGSIITSNK